jgi:hypothetical protein
MSRLMTFKAGGPLRSLSTFVGVMCRRIFTIACTESTITLYPGWLAVRLIVEAVIVRLLRRAICYWLVDNRSVMLYELATIIGLELLSWLCWQTRLPHCGDL